MPHKAQNRLHQKWWSFLPLYPRRYRLPGLSFEGIAKGAVIAEAALLCQLQGGDGALSSNSFAIESDEVVDSQFVDIGIIRHVLLGEMLAVLPAGSQQQPREKQVVLPINRYDTI